MAYDLFSTRTMLNAFEQNFAPKNFLMKTFFNRATVYSTEKIDMDSFSGSRRVAPYVLPRKGAQTMDREGFKTTTYKPPLVGVQFATTAEDLMKRLPGETIYADKYSPDERAAIQLRKDLLAADEMIARREEIMCAQVLFNGKIDMVNEDEGINEVIDYQLPAETLSGTSLWTDPKSNPLEDIDRWGSLMREKSGYSPTMMILGKQAAKALLNNSTIKEMLDIRHIQTGDIQFRELSNGVSYLGWLCGIGTSVELYTYEEWALNELTGKNEPIVPSEKVLLANPAARNEMLYGAVANSRDGVVAAARVPFSWLEPDGSARMLRVNSRPLPVPVDINASFRATVV